MRATPLLGLLLLAALACGQRPDPHAVEDPFGWFHALLSEHVVDGRLDYKGLQPHQDAIRAHLEDLADADLSGLTRREQLAFWINAYNAHVILGVLDGLRPADPVDRGKLFFLRKVRVAGVETSLDGIEKRIRSEFSDPRIHAAVNCASASCPPLRPEAYRADTLDAALEEQTKAYLGDPDQNRLDRERGILYLSQIFEWYEGDFPGGAIEYVLPYLPAADREWIEAHRDSLSVEFVPYDWSLNGSF